jgi:hypothetical protein
MFCLSQLSPHHLDQIRCTDVSCRFHFSSRVFFADFDTDTRRISKSTDKEHSATLPLNVIEIDLAASQLGAPLPIQTDMPRVDGVLICYDASNLESFQHVEGLLRKLALPFLSQTGHKYTLPIGKYRAMRLSTVVLASKSDLEKQVDPQMAIEIIQQYDVGLVEVTNATAAGREKMQRSFQWIMKSIRAARRMFILLP